MIVATGANGKLGRAIVKSLLSFVSAERITASVRSPDKAGELDALGVRVVQADYDQSDSLRRAFVGAEQVLLISSNAAAQGGDPLAQHGNVIAAAKGAGVKRLVYTSHMGASAISAFPPMHTHAATELMLRESGLVWTALRHGFYASSIVAMLRDGIAAGLLVFPEDGKVSWTAHADLAEAAAVVLAQPGRFDGPTPPLTAEAALDLDDIATIAANIVGHPVRRERISDTDMEARLTGRGLPRRVVEISLGLFRASRAGEFATVDPTLAALIDRPTTQLNQVLADELKEG
jgi:NAD(P)H dehydrogenase (quinone)